jgi:hypothetical protein
LSDTGEKMRLQWDSTLAIYKPQESLHLSDAYPIQNHLNQGDSLSLLPLNFALEYSIRNVQENRGV